MIKVKIFGKLTEHFHEGEFELEAGSLKDVLKGVSMRCHVEMNFKHQLIFVNKIQVKRISSVILQPGDLVTILSPAAGG